MVVSLISQVSAFNTQSNLRAVNDRITASTAKLSSGQRVFSAEEDAAALGIGANLNIEISALRAASLNASSGVSMLQVADGAIANIGDIVQRMKSLASQASSGQYSNSERGILDQEYQALKNEIDRMANDTEFDGQPLLSGGSLFDITYAQSMQANGFAGIEIDNATVTTGATYRIEYEATEEVLTVSKIDGGVTERQIVDITALLDNIAGVGQNLVGGEELQLNLSGVGMRLTLDDAFDRTANFAPTIGDSAHANTTLTPTLDVDGNDISLAHSDINVSDEATTALIALDGSGYSVSSGVLNMPIVSAGGAVTLSGVAGIKYEVNGGGIGADGANSANLVGAPAVVDIYVTTASGEEKISTITWDTVATTGDGTGSITANIGTGLLDAAITGNAGDIDLQFMVGSGINAAEDFVNVSLSPLTLNALGILNSNLSTQGAAETAITELDNVLLQVNTERAELGANQSRLEFTYNKLLNDLENLNSAKSDLLDVDVSAEITKLTTDQALSELSINMLSRINQQPQQLLQLLQG